MICYNDNGDNMKKKVIGIIIVLVLIILGVLCLILFKTKNQKFNTHNYYKGEMSNQITEDDTETIDADFNIYYKNKSYSKSSSYNQKAVLDLNSKLMKNDTTSQIDYNSLMKKEEGCTGTVQSKNESYNLSSSCQNDTGKIKVEYALNKCKRTNFTEYLDYTIIQNKSFIIASQVDEEENDEGDIISNNIYVMKINSDGSKAWDIILNDKLSHNDYPNYDSYEYTYIGNLSNDNYDLIILEYTNLYSTDDEEEFNTNDYLILYKIDNKGKVLSKKVLNEKYIVDYTFDNDKFYYFVSINDNEKIILKSIDIEGTNTTLKSQKVYNWYDYAYIHDNNFYFLIDDDDTKSYDIKPIINEKNNSKTIKISKRDNHIKGDIVDFLSYNNQYIIVTENYYEKGDYDETELLLYIFDMDGKLIEQQVLLPMSNEFEPYYLGYYLNNDKLHLLYYFVSDSEYSQYDHFYETTFDSKNKEKSTEEFYVNNESIIFIGQKKYSVYVDDTISNNNYFTVEISN